MTKKSTEQKSIVPRPGAWDEIADFALMFDGYLWAQSAGKDLGSLANDCQQYFRGNGRLPKYSMSEIRAVLFFFHRVHRHGGTEIEDYPEEVKYNDALLEAIRGKLEETGRGNQDQYTKESFRELLLAWDNPQIGAGRTIRITPDGVGVVMNGPGDNNRYLPVSVEQVKRLLVCLGKIDFLNIKPVLMSDALDVAMHHISLEMADVCKMVVYDHGLVDDPQEADYPKGLFELEKIIEHIAEVTDESR